jgi:hypothetical protein
LFKNFYISTQYKIDPSGSGDCITESKVGNVEPKDGIAAYKDGIAAHKVDAAAGKDGTEPPKVKESLRSIYLIALKRYCAFGAPKL